MLLLLDSELMNNWQESGDRHHLLFDLEKKYSLPRSPRWLLMPIFKMGTVILNRNMKYWCYLLTSLFLTDICELKIWPQS